MLFVAVVVVFTGYCAWNLWELHQEYRRLLQEENKARVMLADEQQKFRDNQRVLDRLRNDPAFVALVIRSRLGYARPGELIFRFEQTAPPAANDR